MGKFLSVAMIYYVISVYYDIPGRLSAYELPIRPELILVSVA